MGQKGIFTVTYIHIPTESAFFLWIGKRFFAFVHDPSWRHTCFTLENSGPYHPQWKGRGDTFFGGHAQIPSLETGKGSR